MVYWKTFVNNICITVWMCVSNRSLIKYSNNYRKIRKGNQQRHS